MVVMFSIGLLLWIAFLFEAMALFADFPDSSASKVR